MPRTVRPFGDRAHPDTKGNAIPYDTPDPHALLEVAGNGDQDAWPVELTNAVDIQMVPFEARAFRMVTSEAVIRPPELLLPASDRRGALTIYVRTLGALCTWRVGRRPDDVLRDESSLVVTQESQALRFSWSGQVWAQQRDAVAGAVLVVMSEDWAR